MGIIAALIVGLLAGALAKLFLGNDDVGGLLLAMTLATAGALAVLVLGRLAGWYQGDGEGPGILGSSVGAALGAAIYRLARGRDW